MVHAVFDYLPLAALIDDSVLVLHGGLGDGKWSLDQLRDGSIRRPFSSWDGEMGDTRKPLPDFVLQMLWSDPSDSDAEMSKGVHYQDPRIDPHGRGANVIRFGPDITFVPCRVVYAVCRVSYLLYWVHTKFAQRRLCGNSLLRCILFR